MSDTKIKITKGNQTTEVEITGKKSDITKMIAHALGNTQEFQEIMQDALLMFMGKELAKHGIDIRDVMREAIRNAADMPTPTQKRKERMVN